MSKFGWMLCQPNNAPYAWAESRNYAIAIYTIFKHRTARTPKDLEAEHANLVTEGWKIRPCSIEVKYDDEKTPKRRPLGNEPKGGALPMRRITFDPRRADGTKR